MPNQISTIEQQKWNKLRKPCMTDRISYTGNHMHQFLPNFDRLSEKTKLAKFRLFQRRSRNVHRLTIVVTEASEWLFARVKSSFITTNPFKHVHTFFSASILPWNWGENYREISLHFIRTCVLCPFRTHCHSSQWTSYLQVSVCYVSNFSQNHLIIINKIIFWKINEFVKNNLERKIITHRSWRK